MKGKSRSDQILSKLRFVHTIHRYVNNKHDTLVPGGRVKNTVVGINFLIWWAIIIKLYSVNALRASLAEREGEGEKRHLLFTS